MVGSAETYRYAIHQQLSNVSHFMTLLLFIQGVNIGIANTSFATAVLFVTTRVNARGPFLSSAILLRCS